MASSQPVLAQAQQRIFDKLGREFDSREYTKALRSADSILSVCSDHADTIAMKGLTLHNLERCEEGYDLIKKAIALHPASTIAWHSLGLCQRTEKNYSEALKAFKRALVTDPNNANVLRDISSCCIQLRDWDLFLETREKMVTLKSSVRANWIALSCGHRMLGNTKLAAAVMDVMTSIMDAGENPVEISEVHLYRVELELESGEPRKALDLLKRHDADIMDNITKLLLRAKAHAQLGQKNDAEKRYMEVISMGYNEADCIAAMAHLRKIPLDEFLRPLPQKVTEYMQLLNQIMKASPKPSTTYACRHALDCVPIGDFKASIADFAKSYIVRTIPSLFSVLKSLYQDEARSQIICEVFTEWEKQLEQGNFSSFNGDSNPCFILWVLTYLASHYRRVCNYDMAHAYIDRAIKHTPTLELLYLEKAKIYARQDKTKEAAELADFTRKLDLQDKYLNGKAAKYFFRDNDVETAEATMQLFYRDAVVPGDTYLTALESQCSWYECEIGAAFYRRGDCLSALQNLLMFELHHKHNHCELMDFHNYVFRRNTMRQWFDVISCDDNMGKNKFFLKFCPAVVRTYMKVHEMGEDAVRAAHQPRAELSMEGITADEAKTLTKLRKDYYLENIDLSQPLEKAKRYMEDLLANRASDVKVHTLAVEYYSMLGKPLLVARELLALKKLKCATLASLVEDFEKHVYAKATMDARVKAVVDETIQLVKK